MRFEILIQFIVPLTFLAIWALTTLLNRDAQPLPPRPGRPGGPRPGDAAGGPPDRRFPTLEPSGRGANPPRPADPRNLPSQVGDPNTRLRPPSLERPGSSLDDAIVYLEGEGGGRTSPTGGGQRSAGSGGLRAPVRTQQARRGGRARNPEAVAGNRSRSESQPQRALSDQMEESQALRRARPLEITPLGTPMKRLTRPLAQASATAEVALDRGAGRAVSLSAVEARKALASPEKLRQLLALNEILAPPLALRRRR